jgi:phage tail sheath protein FI
MPASLTYPGVYIEEIPSGVRTITGVATSITAFLGRALRGPVNEPVRIQSFAEFMQVFGGLWKDSMMSYAVSHFFQHGGTDALIVRVHEKAAAATGAADTLNLIAASPGKWGNSLRVRVDHDTRPEVGTEELFNLTVRDTASGVTEFFRNVSVLDSHSRCVSMILATESSLIRLSGALPATRPAASLDPNVGDDPMEKDPGSASFKADGDDGSAITDASIKGSKDKRWGLYALDSADLFNLLCIPPYTAEQDVTGNTWSAAARYCHDRRAMLIIDPPATWTANAEEAIKNAEAGVKTLRAADVGNDLAINAAAYFPRLRMADPLSENRLADFAPCGAIAGIIARTDAQRGVWKAPGGVEASFSGVNGFTYTMTDGQNGRLNPLGLNCLRSFRDAGNVIWGARTLAGADLLASEWKYLPVRRLALFLEESLYRGTQWVVFEPNDEPLWSQIRLNVGAFMQNLFQQGAFQGTSPREAYFVKCDRETTTQNHINLGVVNILVGFAPLKPAEFVVIKIQQMAGQVRA